MVTRVNGAPQQGVWFSKDVRFLNVNLTTNNGADFLADLVDPADLALSGTGEGRGLTQRLAAVDSDLEIALEAIATRGTIVGLTVTAADDFNVIVDYAQAYDDAAVLTEVEALIDALATVTASAITVEQGFVPAALGTAT